MGRGEGGGERSSKVEKLVCSLIWHGCGESQTL